MADEYKLWKVTYQYDIDAIDGSDSGKNSYFVVANSKAEAFKICDGLFSYSSLNRDLLANNEAYGSGARLHNLQRDACEYLKRISFPRLTQGSDASGFDVRARLRNDGRTLEFIVTKK